MALPQASHQMTCQIKDVFSSCVCQISHAILLLYNTGYSHTRDSYLDQTFAHLVFAPLAELDLPLLTRSI